MNILATIYFIGFLATFFFLFEWFEVTGYTKRNPNFADILIPVALIFPLFIVYLIGDTL
jgi:hypothetical protein